MLILDEHNANCLKCLDVPARNIHTLDKAGALEARTQQPTYSQVLASRRIAKQKSAIRSQAASLVVTPTMSPEIAWPQAAFAVLNEMVHPVPAWL
jgi:hypothetical protein